ncbi:hypothetical protein FACS189451_11780 [Bacteroidia bacterium]|nr:hypothetical protein FACS189446_4110 [Bacteroidia bacterium]GHT64273.1 hypothetical protein FACS189451_11780 [Bacteroidia bacterium]
MENLTLQQGLNDVVINKVQRMIQGKETGVRETMSRLVHEGQIAQDYVVPLGVMQRRMEETPVIRFGIGEELVMNMRHEQFSLHDNAVGQLAEKMNIPSQYLRTLARGDEWQKHLAATVLNEHSSQTERQRVLVRSVGTEVRGVLSDSYRRLNSVQILTAFVEEAGKQGAVIADARMTDTKIWAETILPMPITIPTLKNGDVVIFMGARFSTSDYGDGAVDMRAFLLNGVCLNGMVRESVMKQIHLGARLPDNLQLSNKTYELDTQTTVSATRDLTKSLFSRDAIMQKAIEIQGASEIDVDLDSELKKLVKVGSLGKSDSESVQKILMRNNPEDGTQGNSTLWKLTQAITAHARELDDRRSRELHEISGQLMNRVKLSA